MTLDIIAGRALVDDADLMLTRQEFSLLLALAQSEGKTMSAEEVFEKAWKMPLLGEKRSLRKTISEVRAKLNSAGCNHNIDNVYGVGYRFQQQ